MFKNTFYLSLMLAMFSLAACNTVEGVGEDVEAGGAALEDSANDTKGY